MADENETTYRFDTKRIHSSYDPRSHQDAVTIPIYQTTAFDFETAERANRIVHYEELGNVYTRIGNPTVDLLGQRVADLDGGTAGVAVGSGMAAVTYALAALTNIGDHIVVSPFVYGGTYDSFGKTLGRLGVSVDVAKRPTPEDIEASITDKTKAVFIESISNPIVYVSDIEGIAKVAHAHGIPLVVDNSLATPYLIKPIEFGADVVVYSATKGLSGHGNIIAGIIVESGKFNYANGKFPQFSDDALYLLRDRQGRNRTILEVFPTAPIFAHILLSELPYLGAALGPFDAYLALTGLDTLSERIKKQSATAEKIVDYLSHNEFVEFVNYPTLPENENYTIAQRITPKGGGTILSFGLKGTRAQQISFIDATKVFSYLANIGDVRSLIVDSAYVTHAELDDQEREEALIPSNLIRLSIGLEDPSDLIEDLDQAFAASFGKRADRQ
jgi:O-acetylhomoserine (thiol)-lyase